MQINIGGLWERPIAIADERPILSPVYSEINISESAESTTFRCYSKEFHINGEGHDVTDFIHFKSICPEEWDEAETNLHSNAVNSSGTFHENNLKAYFADMDVEQFSLKVQSNNHFENSSDQESMRDIGLSTDQKGTKNDVRADLGMSALCAHASKALKVRSSTTKDRHCKVNTPKGHRDRRVRLAVPTAVQLYNLQDRLGLHQPSKVLDWLMSKAKSAIDELPRPSSISNLNCPSCNTSVQNNGSTVVVVPTSRRAGRKSHSVAKILPFSTQKTENKIGSRNGEDLKVSATNVVHFPVLQNRAQVSTPVKISSARKRRQPSVLSKKENTQLEVIPMTSPFKKQSGCFEIGFNCPKNINSFLAPFNPKGAPLSSWETQVGTDPQRLLTGNYLPFVVYSSESHSDLSQRHAGETSYVSEKCTRPLLSYSQDNGCIYVEEALRLSGYMNSYSDTGVPKLTPNPLCESIASSSTTDSTDGTEVHANGGGN